MVRSPGWASMVVRYNLLTRFEFLLTYKQWHLCLENFILIKLVRTSVFVCDRYSTKSIRRVKGCLNQRTVLKTSIMS